MPPEGTWQVDLTTTELIAAGWPADVTPPGTYTWTFGTDRGTIDVDADDGSQVRCEAEMERTASGFRVTYDDGECGGEVDEIRWELAGDGLHLFLTTTNAPIGQQKAYLETKPWQPVGSD